MPLRLLVATLLLASTACGDEGETAAGCVAAGGHWECEDDVRQTGCRCAPATSDGGTPCQDSDQCEGRCVHTAGGCEIDARGMCQSYLERYACFEELQLEKETPDGPVLPYCYPTCSP